jgi:hypothetical protein
VTKYINNSDNATFEETVYAAELFNRQTVATAFFSFSSEKRGRNRINSCKELKYK